MICALFVSYRKRLMELLIGFALKLANLSNRVVSVVGVNEAKGTSRLSSKQPGNMLQRLVFIIVQWNISPEIPRHPQYEPTANHHAMTAITLDGEVGALASCLRACVGQGLLSLQESEKVSTTTLRKGRRRFTSRVHALYESSYAFRSFLLDRMGWLEQSPMLGGLVLRCQSSINRQRALSSSCVLSRERVLYGSDRA